MLGATQHGRRAAEGAGSMEGAKVLLVDDDDGLRSVTASLLEQGGYVCVQAAAGEQALALAAAEGVGVVVLDVMMPGVDGFAVLERLRDQGFARPVLMLTAKGDIVDKRRGFQLGADDYLVKPFNAEELLLRVEALLRRARAQADGAPSEQADDAGAYGGRSFQLGSLSVDLRHGEVEVDGVRADLTPKERRIMLVLAEHPGQVLSRDEIVEAVWGAEYVSSSVSIPVYVRNLREKIEPDPANPRFLKTVWGQGYRLGD